MQSTSSPRRSGSHSRLSCLLGTSAIAATLFAGAVSAQTTASEQSSAALQEVVVTGSLIKRTDTETPSPVQVISDQDLKNSGFNNVSDVLRNLAANGQGTLNQGFGQAFASGGSGIALRGLTVGNTLTLIDSERMVAYPLSDDGERSFVDVSAIPFNAIDSVEVLKDGASALYGADAIAGVVNIKLKQSYSGAEFTAEYGETQYHDGATYARGRDRRLGRSRQRRLQHLYGARLASSGADLGHQPQRPVDQSELEHLPGRRRTPRPGLIGANGLAFDGQRDRLSAQSHDTQCSRCLSQSFAGRGFPAGLHGSLAGRRSVHVQLSRARFSRPPSRRTS